MKTMLSMKQLVILNRPISSNRYLIITRGLARTIWPLTSYAGPTPRPGGWWPNGPACAASLFHKRFLIWQYKCIQNNVLCGSFFTWRRLWSIFLVILECLDSFFLFQTAASTSCTAGRNYDSLVHSVLDIKTDIIASTNPCWNFIHIIIININI